MCIQIIEKVRRVSYRNQRYKRNDFLWRNDFPGGSDGKTSAYSVGDPGSNLDQEDPLEKEMATHSSVVAWRSPWTEKPGRLQSTGLPRVRHH